MTMDRFRRTFQPVNNFKEIANFRADDRTTNENTVSYLVDLRDNCVENFTFERPKNDSFVLNWVNHEALARLNETGANVVNCCHSDNKTIFAGARSFNFGVQFLFDGLHELRPKIFRMQQNFVLQWNLIIVLNGKGRQIC